jgi:adenine specific DNA methylase Mod
MASKHPKIIVEKNEPGWVQLDFAPRKSLKEFTHDYKHISILKWIAGKKGSNNLAIRGENLASLAALKTGFGLAGKQISVDIIYIDPPYNVGGNQGYKNIWKGISEKERDWAGDHGAFLDFMEPRLKIGRSLLSEEGIIYISICDQEFAAMKILMNQIFGEKNELATFIWNKGRAASSSHAAASHEFILCYAKNKLKAAPLREEKPSAQLMIDKSRELLSEFNINDAQKHFSEWISEEKKNKKLKPGEAAYNMIHPVNHRLFHADNSCAQDDPSGMRQNKYPVTR